MAMMMWEFEVVVDRGLGNPLVPYQVYISKGESEQEVRAAWEPFGEVKSVRALRPWLDLKWAQTYAEACYYLGRSPTGEHISELQARGDFDKPVSGRPTPIPMWKLDRFVNRQWGETVSGNMAA